VQISLTEAARLAGVSRSAIQKAVTRGRLSATRDSAGAWVIDVAELSRVYAVSLPDVGQSTDLSYELSHVREMLSRVENERDWLREQLSNERGERQKLLVLLESVSDKPQPRHSAWPWLVLSFVLSGGVLSLVILFHLSQVKP
jgi:predicted metal-dependent enzyme (double-stranded beta helix superfamily)